MPETLERDQHPPSAADPRGDTRPGVPAVEDDASPFVHDDGTQIWYRDGKRHRDGDQPAMIRADGSQEWWRNGKAQRDGDKPAIIRADGTASWWTTGRMHRLSGPALVKPNGAVRWVVHDFDTPDHPVLRELHATQNTVALNVLLTGLAAGTLTDADDLAHIAAALTDAKA